MIDTEEFRASADHAYWQALAEGRLTMQHCECGKWHWPAVWRCGECGAWDPSWEHVAFEGAVFSWQKCHHPFGGTEGIELPYTSVLVEIDGTDGKRLLGLLEKGSDAKLVVGQRVTGRMEQVELRGRIVPGIRWKVA